MKFKNRRLDLLEEQRLQFQHSKKNRGLVSSVFYIVFWQTKTVLRCSKFGFHAIVILIFPVPVLISHFPPVAVFGTSTLPVPVSVINTLSVIKVPVTFPVVVFIYISAASHSPNFTFPVLLSKENVFAAIT